MGNLRAVSGAGWCERLAVAGLVVAGVAASSGVPAPVHAKRSLPLRSFWTARQFGWQKIPYLRVWSGPNMYIYARPADVVARRDAPALARLYAQTLLPTARRLFGATPGIRRLTLVLAPLDGNTLGYFNPGDLGRNRNRDLTHTNGGNVLYARTPATMPDANRLADTGEVVAHELQHLISYRRRVLRDRLPPQEDWLNEGYSFYTQVAAGFWTPRDRLKVRAALRDPAWPVDLLREDAAFLRRHGRLAYGRAGLFVTYLAGQYGPSLLQAVMRSHETGLRAIDGALRRMAPPLDLPTAYANWSVAQWLRGGGRYGYQSVHIPSLAAPTTLAPPISRFPYRGNGGAAGTIRLPAWGQGYLQLVAPRAGDLRAVVRGAPYGVRAAAILQDSTGTLPGRVRWFRTNRRGDSVLRLPEFGTFYDRLTLAINNVAAGTDVIRVRVTLTVR